MIATRNVALVTIVSLVSSNSFASSLEDGFNGLCDLYTEAKQMNVSTSDGAIYIAENVPQRVNNRDVQELFYSIYNADPKARYSIVTTTANQLLNKQWECPAMEHYLNPIKS